MLRQKTIEVPCHSLDATDAKRCRNDGISCTASLLEDVGTNIGADIDLTCDDTVLAADAMLVLASLRRGVKGREN